LFGFLCVYSYFSSFIFVLFLVSDIIELYLYILLRGSPTLNTDILHSNKGLDVEISSSNTPPHNCIK